MTSDGGWLQAGLVAEFFVERGILSAPMGASADNPG